MEALIICRVIKGALEAKLELSMANMLMIEIQKMRTGDKRILCLE
ncbi:hypothetical protein VCHE16_2037 [Vibrio paracholerae HE-16]|nr:hypothetical protein VCHE09_2343 [Vibrio paracholerae HE-09]EJH67196.1 hypothetical protein VCHE25_1151 [Vibrio cholerae HE-25]EKG86382.1 hypothetical protein VCHE16_2037 [Vibrio paracholerae HE-16]